MQLNKQQIEALAKLARLGLKAGEIKKFQKEISQILDYVEQLKEVDTYQVAPTNQVTNLENVVRHDEAKAAEQQPALLKCAPAMEGRQIKVKKVL